MPAAQQSTSSTFVDFPEARYNLRIKSAKETTSPPPDSNPQHEFEVAIEGTTDPEKGGEIVRRMWTSTKWSEAEGKQSHQYLLARAICGPGVTLEEWERLDYPDLVGKRFSALVALNAGGWPTVNKDSIKPPIGQAAPPTNGQAALPTAPAQPSAPKRPTPPARPAGPDMITDAQREELAKHAFTNYEMGVPELTTWVGENYGGRAVAQLTREEAKQAIETLAVPF